MPITPYAFLSRAPLALVLMVGFGCTGLIEEFPGGGGRSNEPGDLIGGETPRAGSFTLPGATLQRLTRFQYQNALRDLFDGRITVPTELEPDAYLGGFSTVAVSRLALSPRRTEQYETAALAVVAEAFAREDVRSVIVPCVPSNADDAECRRSFVQSFGRRAFRRPLRDEEVARYEALAREPAVLRNDFYAGLEFATLAILQSPYFLYRRELGSPDPSDPGRRILSGYEIASRLAFFLWSSVPDDELLDAAEAGRLTKPDEIRTQAARMFEDPRAREGLVAFFTDLMNLRKMDDLPQLPEAFPELTATLGPAFRAEADRLFEHFVFDEDQSYLDIVSTTRGFVNTELARFYGDPDPGTDALMSFDRGASSKRRGLMGLGAYLAANAHASSTSPTLRGKFIREAMLCQIIPPPPPDVETSLPEDSESLGKTMRERLAVHRENAACRSCHELTDPIGLGLENYDGLGKYRETEAGHVIDPSGVLDGTSFADARELASAVRNHPNLAPCVVKNLYRFATGRLESRGEEPILASLSESFDRSNHRFRALVLDLVSSVAFRYAGVVE